ncbi:MAG TPA: hypothetical protein VIY72_03795 [Acidimicrobiales bacterium]
MSSPRRTERPILPSQLGAPRIVAIVLLTLMAIGIGALRYVATGDDLYLTEAERVAGSLAFQAIVLAPALLALASTRRRAILLLPAAAVLTPVSMLSFAGVLLPVLIPAVLLLVALATRWDGLPCGVPRGLSAVTVVVWLLGAAVAAMLVHDDPRDYASPDGRSSAGTSDVITVAEASISMGLVALAIGLGWLLATPRRRA